MLICYIDESGDTIPLTSKGKKFLVLTGCIICEDKILEIENDLRIIKHKYYQDPEIEFKSNFIRYANPNLEESSILKLNDFSKYQELEEDLSDFLKRIPVTVISVVIDKKAYWEKYPSQNPYNVAYSFLLERFQYYLNQQKALGIAIIDPREGQVEKRFIGNELDIIHRNMRWSGGKYSVKCPNIVEKLLYSESDKTIGIQIADLFCYPVFNVFEYNKTKDEYWRFKEITFPKLDTKNGKVDGVGLKFFPTDTKKDLRIFADLSTMGAIPRDQI